MADNRTNEPTEAQVEAVARVMAGATEGDAFYEYPFAEWRREEFRDKARAALVAAAGAAPQAERDDSPTPGNHAPVLPSSTVDEALRFCTCSHWLEAHHERKCLEHHCACVNFQPVLQIDEDALAGVIWQEQSDRVRDGYVIHTRETARSTARAVAEWLKEQGR